MIVRDQADLQFRPFSRVEISQELGQAHGCGDAVSSCHDLAGADIEPGDVMIRTQPLALLIPAWVEWRQGNGE